MEEVFATYIWSENWWVFSNESWNAQAHAYEDSEIISQDVLDWNLVSNGEAYHASLYFEKGKTDAHEFTPTSIEVDNIIQPTRVRVEGTVTGYDGQVHTADPFEYEVGSEGSYQLEGTQAGYMDFQITEIIVASDEEQKEEIIVSFIEEITKTDQEYAETLNSETFNAPRKLPTKRQLRRTNRSRKNKNLMRNNRFSKSNKPTDKQMRYSENFTTSKYAESFRSEGQSDAIAAESSQTVSGVNPTPVSDGQWLAETISKRAEAKHSYPHRTIQGDNYVHHDSKGRETRRTNRGKSIKADRRRYTPNDKLKPGQGHLGDFVREAQGYDDRLDESMGIRNRGRTRGKMTKRDRRDMSRGIEKEMGRRPDAAVRTMDRRNRRLRAERSLRSEMTRDDRDMESSGMERFMRQNNSRKSRRAESPLTSPESYSPTGSSPTDMNPKSAGPSSAGTGNEVIAVESPSAPPSNIKFAETKRSEFGVVGQGSNFGQDLNAESICAKHAETYEACGCEKRRAEPSGTNLTNAATSGTDPLDDTTLSGFDIVNVDSPSAPPSNVFEQSAEECGCIIGADGVCMCAETKSAEMNYDGSLYGDQYFPDALTANQVNIGKLGSTPSADTSGQGVLEWDGSRVGPNPDTKASEVINRQGVKWVVGIVAAVGGGYLLLNNLKKE